MAPCRKAKQPGSGKHYQSPHRLRSLEILGSAFGKALYKARTAIERSFGHAGSFGSGLGLWAGPGTNLGVGETPD